jgi:osmotically-inducible protein OsmY
MHSRCIAKFGVAVVFALAAGCAETPLVSRTETTAAEVTADQLTPVGWPAPSSLAVERAVAEVYARDPHLLGERVGVSARNGVVSLRGNVRTLLAKERVVADAKATRGVRGVVDRVTIPEAFVADSEIAEGVRRRLRANTITAPYAIDVKTHDGVVCLSGNVGSWQAMRVAREAAAETVGAREIHLFLAVDPEGSRSDATLRAEVESRLHDDTQIDPRLVRVDVQNGVVDLVGQVADGREGALVERDAWGTGVRAVRLHLRLLHDTDPTPNAAEGPAVSDAQIGATVLDTFSQDPRLTGSSPRVTVRSGAVDLRGTVLNESARQAAQSDAENAWGVTNVRNDLLVANRVIGPNEAVAKGR